MKSLFLKNLHQHYRIAVAVSFALLLLVLVFLFIFGKTGSFILINGYYNRPLDYFFQFATFLGDGLIYIPIVLYSLIFNRKFFIPVIAGIVFCTLLAQGLKRFAFSDQLRPIHLEEENVVIHKIEGVPMRRMHSFPSGHTSAAFTMALLLASVMRKKIWAFVLPFLAMLVGYSRVYLAQHFVTDVAAGMLIGITSSYLALLIYDVFHRRSLKRKAFEKAPV